MAKFISFDFYGSHKYLKYLLKYFKILRNYHNSVKRRISENGPYYALGQIIAQAVNATLVADGHPKYLDEHYPSSVQLF